MKFQTALPWRKECVWNHICQDSIVTQSWRMFRKGCQILRAPLSWLFIYFFVLLFTVVLLFIISIFVKSQLYLFLNLHDFLVRMWCGIHISLHVFAILRRICDKFATLVIFHKQFSWIVAFIYCFLLVNTELLKYHTTKTYRKCIVNNEKCVMWPIPFHFSYTHKRDLKK